MSESRLNGPEEPDGGELSEHETLELKERLRSRGCGAKTPECPGEDRLRMLAAGLLGEREAGKLLSHAVECLWCGAVLHDSAEDLRPETTEEEWAFAAESKWADPVERRILAERLATGAAQQTGEPKRRFPWKFWVPAAAFAAAMGSGGVFLWPVYLVNQTERELSKAYTEFRPMEMRLPGADYNTIGTERGIESSRINRSPDLHEAEARILREVGSHPDDPRWLHLEGRAHLLTGKEDEAIAELERARTLRPQDPQILSDLGIAYFQKAQRVRNNAKLLVLAFENLSEATKFRPNSPTYLFNNAVAAESIYAYQTAGDLWKRYLHIDSTSGWAKEAQIHLDGAKKKLTYSDHISLVPDRKP